MSTIHILSAFYLSQRCKLIYIDRGYHLKYAMKMTPSVLDGLKSKIMFTHPGNMHKMPGCKQPF